MFALTRQEKTVILFLIVTCVCGAVCQYIFKKFPFLYKATSLLESTSIIKKADINKASYQELLDVPFIGPVSAGKIIDYRAETGPIKNIDDLKKAGLSPGVFKKALPFLEGLKP